MKIKGKRLESTNEVTIVLPRYNGEDIIFKAKVILDYPNLDKFLTKPEAPSILIRGKQEKDYDNKGYKTKLQKNYEHRLNYMVLLSLAATEGLEWETVDMEKPETWGNWETELKDAGIPNSEVIYIFNKIQEVNSLDQDKLDEARERFLLIQLAQKESS